MSAPRPAMRAVTYERDGHRCVSCCATTHLQYQHRRRVGMGGSKALLRFCDGVTSCAVCNPLYESSLQTEALKYGWKVRAWVQDTSTVPVFYPAENQWFELTDRGRRIRITRAHASWMMHAVYGEEFEVET